MGSLRFRKMVLQRVIPVAGGVPANAIGVLTNAIHFEFRGRSAGVPPATDSENCGRDARGPPTIWHL